MASKKKKAKEAALKQETPSKFRQDIVGILLLALAVFIFISNISSATGMFGLFFVRTILRSILGIGVLVLPVFIATYGVILMLRREVKELTIRLTGLSILFLTYITVCQFYSANYFNEPQAEYFIGAGGLIGFAMKFALTRTIGVSGAYIFITAFILIGTLMVFNITMVAIISMFMQLLKFDKKETVAPVPSAVVKTKLKEQLATKFPLVKGEAPAIEVVPAPPAPIFEPKPLLEFPLPKYEPEVEARSDDEEEVIVDDEAKPKKKTYSKYKLPSLDLLEDASAKEKGQAESLRETTELRKKLLEDALRSFGVGAHVVSIFQGPAVTRYELQPEPGVKVSRIANLADDIALNLAAQGVRIEAPVPGKSVVGIEVPNATVVPVRLKEIARTNEFRNQESKLFICIGKDLAGLPIYGDLAKMPHLLIAGTTGSGKSVCINSLIISILLRARPDEVKMLMIDPKMVELSVYNDIPHLLAPVVTDPRRAAATFKEWVVNEMERRYHLFHDSGVRNLAAYNHKMGEEGSIPHILVIVDELADLMMIAANEVEASICRIAQMARATGIHLVIATQRPSVDVITGLIKANIPSRIAFAVATQIDSRVILDSSGAEKLLGRGDMLYNPIGAMKPTRVQGCFVSDREAERIIKFVKDQAEPEYIQEIVGIKAIEFGKGKGGSSGGEGQDQAEANEKDVLFADVAKLIIESQQSSTSYVQRKFRIGYNRAARLMDEMQEAGIVSAPEGDLKTRRVVGTRETLTGLGIN